MKYVIVERKKPLSGFNIKFPIIFSEHLVHRDMVPVGYKAFSAGEVIITGERAKCSGKSVSLGLSSHPFDSTFVSNWLLFGDSLLAVLSETYD